MEAWLLLAKRGSKEGEKKDQTLQADELICLDLVCVAGNLNHTLFSKGKCGHTSNDTIIKKVSFYTYHFKIKSTLKLVVY
jgi:hypothetical protein